MTEEVTPQRSMIVENNCSHESRVSSEGSTTAACKERHLSSHLLEPGPDW